MNAVKTKSTINKNKKTAIWVTIIIAIALIIILIITFGKVKDSKKSKIPKEFKDPKEDVKKNHDALLKKIKDQEIEKNRLDKIVRNIFLSIRILSIFIWAGILINCYVFGFINNLGDALNISEVIILLLLIIYFLRFGSISSLKEFTDIIRMRTENFVYRKNINLNDDLKNNKKQLIGIERQIKV